MTKKFRIETDIARIGFQKISTPDKYNPEVEYFETKGYKETKEAVKEAKGSEVLFGHRIIHTLGEEIGGKFAKKVRPKSVQYLWDAEKKDWDQWTRKI